MRLETGISKVGLREGYSPTIDPSPFVRSYDSAIRAGEQMQNLGGQLGDLAVAEQKVYNATQVDMLNTRRKMLTNELLQGLRNSRDPANLETEFRAGYRVIEKGLLKVPKGTQPYNDRIKTLVVAEGRSYIATKLPSVQKEARVYRLNAQKTQVIDTVKALRGSLLQLEDPIMRQSTSDSISQLLATAVEHGIMLPSEASDELLKIDKDVEGAFIRRKMNAADTIEEFDTALATTQYMDEETLEIRRDQFRIRLRERRSLKLREEEALYKQGVRDRKEVHRVGDAAIRDRANDPDPLKRPNNDELDQLLGEDKISTSAYKDVKTEILNPPTAEPETNWDTYETMNSDIHHEDGPQVTVSEIGKRKDLADTEKRTLLAQLQAVEHGTVDPRVTEGWKIIGKTIGTPEAFTKAGKMGLSKEAKVLNREFIDRYQAGEDPIEVANDISNRWLEADDVTSRTSQNRTARRLIELPEEYQSSTRTAGALQIPNTAIMEDKIVADYESKKLSQERFNELMDQVQTMEETWTPELQEQHGGQKMDAAIVEEQAELASKNELAAEEAERKRVVEEKAAAEEAERKRVAEEKAAAEEAERKKVAEKAEKESWEEMLKSVDETARSFNIDPEKMVQSLEPLFRQMGGFESINDALAQATGQPQAEVEDPGLAELEDSIATLREQIDKRTEGFLEEKPQAKGESNKEKIDRLFKEIDDLGQEKEPKPGKTTEIKKKVLGPPKPKKKVSKQEVSKQEVLKTKPKPVEGKSLQSNMKGRSRKELQKMRIDGSYFYSDEDIQAQIDMYKSERDNLSQSDIRFLSILIDILETREFIRNESKPITR